MGGALSPLILDLGRVDLEVIGIRAEADAEERVMNRHAEARLPIVQAALGGSVHIVLTAMEGLNGQRKCAENEGGQDDREQFALGSLNERDADHGQERDQSSARARAPDCKYRDAAENPGEDLLKRTGSRRGSRTKQWL